VAVAVIDDLLAPGQTAVRGFSLADLADSFVVSGFRVPH
jgi:adenine/guanine phosphoribosyltransferase-like PRPP-binding protein